MTSAYENRLGGRNSFAVRMGKRIREFFVDGAHAEAGIAAVEFAMLFPIFILFLYAFVEFGRASIARASIQYAVEEGARFAVVNDDATTSQVETVAQNNVIFLQPGDVSFNAAFDTPAGSDIRFVDISATFTFSPLLVPSAHWGSVNLQATSRLAVPAAPSPEPDDCLGCG